jgi:heat shock protein HslJ
MFRLTFLCLLALSLLGCGGNNAASTTSSPTPSPEYSLEGKYLLTEVTGIEMPAGESFEVTIEDGRIAGRGPVNRWFSGLQEGNRLGPIASTMMAGPEDRMAAEYAFHQLLADSTLRLLADGNVAIEKDGGTIALLIRQAE